MTNTTFTINVENVSFVRGKPFKSWTTPFDQKSGSTPGFSCMYVHLLRVSLVLSSACFNPIINNDAGEWRPLTIIIMASIAEFKEPNFNDSEKCTIKPVLLALLHLCLDFSLYLILMMEKRVLEEVLCAVDERPHNVVFEFSCLGIA